MLWQFVTINVKLPQSLILPVMRHRQRQIEIDWVRPLKCHAMTKMLNEICSVVGVRKRKLALELTASVVNIPSNHNTPLLFPSLSSSVFDVFVPCIQWLQNDKCYVLCFCSLDQMRCSMKKTVFSVIQSTLFAIIFYESMCIKDMWSLCCNHGWIWWSAFLMEMCMRESVFYIMFHTAKVVWHKDAPIVICCNEFFLSFFLSFNIKVLLCVVKLLFHSCFCFYCFR